VTIEIINTGSELMLGRVLNTHQQWLCRQLADHGYTVERQVAIADGGHDIQQAVRESLGRADLIITTGGLGPTSDDLTRQLVAELLGLGLEHDPEVEQTIRHYFESRGRQVPRRTRVEALIPTGARVLPNRFGTAPGLMLTVDPNSFRPDSRRSVIIMLPGPPRELRPMFTTEVLPLLSECFASDDRFFCRTLKTTGLGESYLEEAIAEPLAGLTASGLELGYCARVGEVEVRLGARGSKAADIVNRADAIVRACIAEHIFGVDDESLEAAVIRSFTAHRWTLAIAESCTGGHITNRLTNVPGASLVLVEGFITYSNDAKIRALSVGAQTLRDHGAVSEATVREMAEGARKIAGADWSVAVTGIAGPGGGSPDKPVGTVYLAWSSAQGTTVSHQLNPFDRETFKFLTSQQALHGLLNLPRRD